MISVFVCGIDVKNSRPRDKGKNAIEYVIQVSVNITVEQILHVQVLIYVCVL